MINVYLSDNIVLIQSEGVDKWGEPLSPTEISLKALIDYKTRLVRNFAGEEVVASARIMLKNMILSHNDKIKFDDIEHAILNIAKKKDFSKNKYLLVDVS